MTNCHNRKPVTIQNLKKDLTKTALKLRNLKYVRAETTAKLKHSLARERTYRNFPFSSQREYPICSEEKRCYHFLGVAYIQTEKCNLLYSSHETTFKKR